MVNHTVTKPKAPSNYADLARNMVGNGKPRLGSIRPASPTLYQPLPAATIKYTLMKHPFTKTLALATVMILGCTLLHYLIGSMSY